MVFFAVSSLCLSILCNGSPALLVTTSVHTLLIFAFFIISNRNAIEYTGGGGAQADNSTVFSPSRLTVHQSACLGVESLLGLITRIFKRLSSLSRRRQGLSLPGVRRREGLSVPGVRRRQRLSVPGCQYLSSVLKFKLASLGSYQMLHTDMRRLTTGIRTAKCVVRRFLRCANVI